MMPWQLQAAAAGAALALAFGAGWIANGWRKDAEIAQIRKVQAEGRADQAEAALGDMAAAAKAISTAATQYAAAQSTLGAKLDLLQKEFKNAKPLPADCRPDDFRLRSLRSAVDAANAAAAGQ